VACLATFLEGGRESGSRFAHNMEFKASLLIYSIFVLSVTFLLVPLMRFIGLKYSLYDQPGSDPLKIHRGNVPYLGGVAMAVALVLGTIYLTRAVLVDNLQLWAIVCCSSCALMFGLWDDMKWKSFLKTPAIKFHTQFLLVAIIAMLLWASGVCYGIFYNVSISYLFGVIYILGAMNALNMQDGMDGLAAGIAGISGAGFSVLGVIQNSATLVVLGLGIACCSFGFLRYNLPPARIFMGDSGSYFLGALIGSALILASSRAHSVSHFVVPLMIFGLPVADAGFAIIRRLSRHGSPFYGDRAHYYDKLLKNGMSHNKVLIVSYSIQTCLAAIGIWIMAAKG